MKTVVVGYDGSEAAERALARAADVAEAFSARLVVVSVSESGTAFPAAPLEPAGPMLGPPGAAGPLPEVLVPEAEEPEERARHRLDAARTSLAGRRVAADYVAEVGEASERLLAVAERRDADLIVVGSPHHGFLERLLGGAVDEAVVRRSRRDVLLVH
jgi:nucleotide-binding universal stress UspA family protein